MRMTVMASGPGRMLSSQTRQRWNQVSIMRRKRDSYIITGMKPLRFILFLCVFPVCAVMPASAAELVMVEQAGCAWCDRWDTEIGGIYDRTAEGRIAPLRRIDIHDPLPADLGFIDGLVFTPTFVLVEGGREIGRINGYAGEDFFWGLLHRLIEKLPRSMPAGAPAPDGLQRTEGAPDKNPARG